jgi:hypothetical protein
MCTAIRVRTRDCRAPGGLGHLPARAQVVVHADLQDVGLLVRHLVGDRPHLLGSRAVDDGSGHEDPGAIDGPRGLFVAQREAALLIVAEAEDRRDAVLRVGAELAYKVLARMPVRIRSEADGIADVTVRIDEPGHQGLARQIDARGAGGYLRLVDRAHGGDLAVPDDDRAAIDDTARAVDDAGADERRRLRGRGRGETHQDRCDKG